MANQQNTDYLSGEVQEILSKPPSWVASWGASILAGAVALLAVAGIFLRYPDVVEGDLTLTTQEPPVPVVSPNTGHLAKVLAKEGVAVRENDVLAVFSSTANPDDVRKLEEMLDDLSELDLATIKGFKSEANLRLGEIAPTYTSFVNVLAFFPKVEENFQVNPELLGDVENYIGKIERDLRELRKQKEEKRGELDQKAKDLQRSHNTYAASQKESDGRSLVKANQELEGKNQELSSVTRQIEERKDDLFSQKARLLELQLAQDAGSKEKIYQLTQSLSSLKSEIRRWKDKYLIVAPADGTVSFFTDLAVQQYVTQGEEVFAVVPVSAGEKRYVGRVKVPATGSGKVKPGQAVNIKFDRYPFREFGQVAGRVEKIYPLSKENFYYVDVSLENSLTTTKGRRLDFYQRLSGSAEIVTENRRFVSRLFEKLWSAWD